MLQSISQFILNTHENIRTYDSESALDLLNLYCSLMNTLVLIPQKVMTSCVSKVN